MKKRTIKIKPVGMVFKVEKKLAGGLLKTGIKAAVRSKPFKAARKKILKELKSHFSIYELPSFIKDLKTVGAV